jgi:hypothetical protein
MGRRRQSLSIALAAAAMTAGPAAAASAATIAVNKACFDENAPMTVTGAGFTPGDTVDLSATGVFSTAPVDAGGQFAVLVTAPLLGKIGPAHHAFTLTATSESNPSLAAAAPFDVTTFAVSTKPAQARPSKRVRFSFSGFTPGRSIYAHYVHKGTVRATSHFGIAAPPCGTLSARERLYPGNHPATGLYHVQFDSRRHYSPSTAPKLLATLHIFKSFSL